jgi:hypothetical protein
MNREIKFRGWDKALKEMSYTPLHSISFNGTLNYGNADFTDYPIEIMQFTGLHDKNGKEIYEGDIVEYEFAPCGLQRGEFIFNEGTFYLKGTGKFRPYDCEIIGNIYENTELLKP